VRARPPLIPFASSILPQHVPLCGSALLFPAPSFSQPRGHQFPAAVMAIASGLDKHGGDSADPIAYAHCDMGGASVAAPFLDGVVTGNPVAAFVARYFLNLSASSSAVSRKSPSVAASSPQRIAERSERMRASDSMPAP